MTGSREGSRTIRYVVVAAGTVFLLWLVLFKSASFFYTYRQPELALKFDSANNFALSKIAISSMIEPGEKKLDLRSAEKTAKEAVMIAPRDSAGLAVLAFAADNHVIAAKALPLAEKAQKYSKRELLSQLYFIDYYAKRNDIQKVLFYYNLALTTHPEAQQLLLPKLYYAMSSSDARRGLLKLLAQNPSWKKNFWLGLTDQRPIPASTLALIREAAQLPKALAPGIIPRAVRGLVSSQRYDEAAQIASLAGANNGVVRSVRQIDDFDRDNAAPPIDWEYLSSGKHNAYPGTENLILTTRSPQSEIFARRILFLPSGQRFMIEGALSVDTGSGTVRISLRCSQSDNPLTQLTFSISRNPQTVQKSSAFVVPEGCEQQWIEISGRSARASRMQAEVSALAIEPEEQ